MIHNAKGVVITSAKNKHVKLMSWTDEHASTVLIDIWFIKWLEYVNAESFPEKNDLQCFQWSKEMSIVYYDLNFKCFSPNPGKNVWDHMSLFVEQRVTIPTWRPRTLVTHRCNFLVIAWDDFSQANVRLLDIASIPASLLWIHHGMAIGRTATSSSYGRCPSDVQIETSTVRCDTLAVEGYIASPKLNFPLTSGKPWDLWVSFSQSAPQITEKDLLNPTSMRQWRAFLVYVMRVHLDSIRVCLVNNNPRF